MSDQKNSDVIIIGGGLAGLTAATYLGKAGRSVRLFEQARQLGGRAQTQEKKGFQFNLGPHALYQAGEGVKVLQELNIPFSGHTPKLKSFVVKQGKKFKLKLLKSRDSKLAKH